MKAEKYIFSALLLFFLISGLYYAATNSITSDELTHITTGYINLTFNDYRFNTEHPPLIKQLAALPLLFMRLNFPFGVYQASAIPMDIVKIQEPFLFTMGNNLNLILFLTRIPNILISLFLGILIYLLSRRINGVSAGVISLTLFVFSPSFLGHSPLVTMDTAVSCLYFATIYFLIKFFESKRSLHLSMTGIFLGLSLAAKYSALLLIPVIYILVAIYGFLFLKEREEVNPKFIFLLPLLPFAISYKASFKFIAPALLAYIFCSTFYRKNRYSKKVRFISAVLLIILIISFSVVIMDYTDYKWFPFHSATKAYFKGFSSFEGHAASGQDAYLLGRYSEKGWWYYFPMAIFFKEPFAFLLIFLSGLACFVLKKGSTMTRLCLIVPPLVYLFAAMFINKVNIGIRHILPVYPFMYVIAGYSAIAAKRFKSARYGLILLLTLLILDVIIAYPAHLSYINRVTGGTANGCRFLSDSNVAWGQDWRRLKKYIDDNKIEKISVKAYFNYDKNCRYYKIPYRVLTEDEMAMPRKGFYIIEAAELSRNRIIWLNRIRPISRVGGSLYVYNVTDKEINILRTN